MQTNNVESTKTLECEHSLKSHVINVFFDVFTVIYIFHLAFPLTNDDGCFMPGDSVNLRMLSRISEN